MRVWDVAPARLCDRHLIGEHSEVHAIWAVLTGDQEGYRDHPETQRWEGKLGALFTRHEQLVEEMEARGFNHGSPMDAYLAKGLDEQDTYVDPPQEQLEILAAKDCECPLDVEDAE